MLKKPEEWEEISGIRVVDPDGWRRDGASFDEPCTQAQFRKRCGESTVQGECKMPRAHQKVRIFIYNEEGSFTELENLPENVTEKADLIKWVANHLEPGEYVICREVAHMVTKEEPKIIRTVKIC